MTTPGEPLVTFFTWFWAVFFTLCLILYIAGQISKAKRRAQRPSPAQVALRQRLAQQQATIRAKQELLRQQRQQGSNYRKGNTR